MKKEKLVCLLLAMALFSTVNLSAQFLKKLSKGIENVTKEVDKVLGETSAKGSITTPHRNLVIGSQVAELAGKKFYVQFTLTNKGEDITRYFLCGYESSNNLPKAFDNLGNECKMIMTFGDNVGHFNMGVGNALYNNIPVKVTLEITGFSSQATSISQIRIHGKIGDNQKAPYPAEGDFIFKNIPMVSTTVEQSAQTETPATASAATSNQSTAKSGLNIAKTKGVMSVSDAYNAYDNRKRITAGERMALKINNIKNPDFNVQTPNSKISKGETLYEGEYGKLQTILYIEPDNSTDEYLLSYNDKGQLVDCVTLGSIRAYGGDRGEGTIEGDMVTARFSAEGTSFYVSYQVTPEMKLIKIKEWEAQD